jgi:hypothetical protein
MARRPLPAALAFAAFVADLSGAHGVALVALLGAIPAAFVLTLDCFADALQSRCTLKRPVVAGAGLLLLVMSATLRSPAVVGGVPQIAVSAVVFSLLLYAGLAVAALVAALRSAQAPRVARVDAVEAERLAA